MQINNNIENLRIPPQSVEAEQCVLGGLMIRNEAYDEIVDKIFEDVFYRADHRLIFRAISYLFEHNKPMDLITVSEILEHRKKLEEAGGLAYIGTLVNDIPSAANIQAYAEIVYEKYYLRSAIEIGFNLVESAYSTSDISASEIVNAAETSMLALSASGQKTGPMRASEFVHTLVCELDERFNSGGGLTGLGTGSNFVDRMTSGLQRGSLAVLAARPSMGKTAYAMGIVANVALKSKLAVLVFSLETTSKNLLNRMASSIGGIPLERITHGKMMDSDWPKFTDAMRQLKEADIYIDDTSGLNFMQIRTRARKLKREKNLGLIMVDFLQQMGDVETRINTNKNLSVAANIQALKVLSKELDVCVLCLSQLNRDLERRNNKRPIMSDLRDSGAIEQDADLIMFLYRDEVYNTDTNHKNIAELNIAKNKDGPIDTGYLFSELEKVRFTDYIGEVPKHAQGNNTNQGFD